MSWKDKDELFLSITTPDKRVYTPLWKNAQKNVEWNGAEFPFLDVEGIYVNKEKLLARRFPLELYFLGDDHLDVSGSFELSLNAKAPCIIEHPYYNTILAQILSLDFDNSEGNVTKVTCTAIETITETGLRVIENPVEAVKMKLIDISTLSETELEVTPSVTEIHDLKQSLEKNKKKGNLIIKLAKEAETYSNTFNIASNYINNITDVPILAMRATINLITLPAKFEANVRSRIQALFDMAEELFKTTTGLTTSAAKQLFQIQSTNLLSAMCYAAVTPDDFDYTNSTDAIAVIDKIQSAYRQYQTQLDLIQSPNGGNPEFYIPSVGSLSVLNDMVNMTISNLVAIALNGKTERSIILEEDSNVILLTHRFYGMDDADQNLDKLISNNKLLPEDMLGLEKGRKIIYYI